MRPTYPGSTTLQKPQSMDVSHDCCQTLSAHAVDPAAGYPRSTAAWAMPHAMQLLISKLLREGPGGCPAGTFPNPTRRRCAPLTCFQSRKSRSVWGNVKKTRVPELLRGNNLSTEDRQGASLVAQWLQIRLPMQGTRVRALVQEDPTYRRATKLLCHNY